MIISQALGLDQSETHKPGYFGDTMPSPLSLTASVPSVGHNSGPTAGIYPPSEGYFTSGRVQTDLPNMGMYAAQTDTSSISSPGNYVQNPATVATVPGLMGSHYASGLQPSAYPPLTDDYEMRPAVAGMWHGGYAQPPPSCYPYESSFGPQYPYDRYCGVDINDGVRRKNATRESTNTLKAWLQEHKKNPYPTKGEKIMLAIITKMTLTQVSTWFANARRRLKKENKMTWVPKNRSSDSSNNSNSKKTDEDDDDVTSPHSNENDCKSDIDPSLDSDDSDARKVTSTNTNDDITSSDLKDTLDFQHEQCSINSDGTTHQSQQDFSSPVHDDPLRSNFGSYDHKEKTWPTSNDETSTKPADGIINSSGISSYEGENCRSEPSTVIRQASSLVSPSLLRTDDICEQTDLKYQPHDWPHIPCQYGSESNPNQQIQSNRPAEEIEPLHSHSPLHVGEVKSNFSRSTFAVSSVTESCAVAPAPSSFVHGYSSQHGVPPPHMDYYRGMERLPGDLNPSSYYPRHDLRARTELKVDTIPNPFSSSGEPLQPKTPTLPGLSSASLLASEAAASVQKPVYQPNLSPQYVPNVKLVKSVPSSTTTHAPSYFPHSSFNQSFANGTGSALDYYQRKGFYSPESSSYHMPSSSSPRK